MNAIVRMQALPPALQNAISTWADASTRPDSARRRDLLRDKSNAVASFFEFVQKGPGEVTEIDVKLWQAELERRGLSHSTIYGRISRLSAFFDWMLKDAELSKIVRRNPVRLARPKAPKAYQSESTKALSDDEVKALVAVVKEKASRGDVVAKRDYALLVFYLTTGMRRSEIIRLGWGDLKINGSIVVTVRTKGGDYREREIKAPAVKEALLDYLTASGRLATMTPDAPLWTRHDRAGRPGAALTGHAFAKNLKRYALEAGLGDVHLHQLRHTFARIRGEDTGNIAIVQEELGHKNRRTTQIYLQRVGVLRDNHSQAIARRLGL